MAIKVLIKNKESDKIEPKEVAVNELSNYLEKSVVDQVINIEVHPGMLDKVYAELANIYLSNKRVGTKAVKGRSQVRGKAAKPYRQKGTGLARHGSKKSPIFVGGGVAHGPVNKQNNLKVNKKFKKRALLAGLKNLMDQDLCLFEIPQKGLDTKSLKQFKDNFDLSSKTIFFVKDKDSVFAKSIRNNPNVSISQLNCFTVINGFDYKNVYVDINYLNEVVS